MLALSRRSWLLTHVDVVAPAGISDLLRQAEVANHQRGIRALCTQQHILELEVEVRDPELVQVPSAGDHLLEEAASYWAVHRCNWVVHRWNTLDEEGR